MNKLAVWAIGVLSGVGVMAQDKTVVSGNFGQENAPKEVSFFYRAGESVVAPVRDGRFSVELPTDVTKSYSVRIGGYVETIVVPEGGVLTIGRRPDGRYAVKSDRENSLSERIDSLVEFRRTHFRDSTLMIDEYKRVIAHNRDNAVGYVALLFLSNWNTDPKTIFDLAGSLAPNMLAEPRTSRLRKEIEAAYLSSVGMKFRDFGGIGPDGNAVRLSDFAGKGKYILLDFWSTSCGPCRRAFPHIRGLYEELGGESFDIVGIPVWENAGLSQRTIAEAGLTWKNILGTEGAAAELYGVTYVPTYLLLAPDGTIIARDALQDLEPLVRGLLE